MLLTTSRRRVRWVAVLCLALLLGATAWAFTDRPGQPASSADRPGPSPAELSEALPFSSLLQQRSPAELDVLKAQRQLTIACMAKLGFPYRPAPIVSAAETSEEHPTPFGLESLTAPAVAATQRPPSEAPVSKAFTRALYGDEDHRISAKGKLFEVTRPAEGCQAEAETRLLGDQRLRRLQLRVQLGEGEKEARQQLEKDPLFREANARWQRCLRAAGFDAKDPVSLLYDVPRGTDPRDDPAVRADVRCKAETDYLGVAYTRLHAVQQTWLDRHDGALTTWQTLQRRQVEAAREVLGTR